MDIEKGISTKIFLSEWFKFAQKNWETTNQLLSLENYLNLK